MGSPVYYNSGRYAAMLRDLLDTDNETANIFERHFRTYGMVGFMKNLDTLDVPIELNQRLQAVKDVLDATAMNRR